MNDMNTTRMTALDQAIRIGALDEAPDVTIKRAETYYAFLTKGDES